jgi:hypothetical protein
LQHRLAAFACAVVYDIEAVGARSVIAAVVFQKEIWLAVPIVECDSFRHGAEGLFHKARGNPYAVPFRDRSARLLEQVYCFLVIEADAGSSQNFEAGVV